VRKETLPLKVKTQEMSRKLNNRDYLLLKNKKEVKILKEILRKEKEQVKVKEALYRMRCKQQVFLLIVRDQLPL